ncbi:MAG: DUF4276 family protein [Magnetococcales bacterium]|nr:DUF4276 family protein [Magnetococcales bacterium]
MVKSLRIFVEGGGEIGQGDKYLARDLREAFKKFFICAGLPERRIHINRCGSRNRAFEEFRNKKSKDEINLLLVDSEDPVPEIYYDKPLAFLKVRDNFVAPNNISDEQVHLMTQCMESWFLADLEAVQSYFGSGCNLSRLPTTKPIEAAEKQAIFDGLNHAAQNTTKHHYRKGRDAFAILKLLDPEKVQRHSPWACRLLQTMDNLLVESIQSARNCP